MCFLHSIPSPFNKRHGTKDAKIQSRVSDITCKCIDACLKLYSQSTYTHAKDHAQFRMNTIHEYIHTNAVIHQNVVIKKKQKKIVSSFVRITRRVSKVALAVNYCIHSVLCGQTLRHIQATNKTMKYFPYMIISTILCVRLSAQLQRSHRHHLHVMICPAICTSYSVQSYRVCRKWGGKNINNTHRFKFIA